MADKLNASLRMNDFNRWKVDDLNNILKERGHKTTYRVKRELVTVAFALYQLRLSIVVANVDDLEQVDVDYQTLLTNESNSEYLKCLTNFGQLLRRRRVQIGR